MSKDNIILTKKGKVAFCYTWGIAGIGFLLVLATILLALPYKVWPTTPDFIATLGICLFALGLGLTCGMFLGLENKESLMRQINEKSTK